MARLKLTLVPSPDGLMLLAVRLPSVTPFRRKRTVLAPWRFAPLRVTGRVGLPRAPAFGATPLTTGPPVTDTGPLAAGVLCGARLTLTGALAVGPADGVTATLTGAAASIPLTWPTTRTLAVAICVRAAVSTASMGTGWTGGGVLGAV
jgi:hypothetical protein